MHDGMLLCKQTGEVQGIYSIDNNIPEFGHASLMWMRLLSNHQLLDLNLHGATAGLLILLEFCLYLWATHARVRIRFHAPRVHSATSK